MCLLHIPTLLFFDKKITPLLPSYMTYGFFTSVIYSSIMLTKLHFLCAFQQFHLLFLCTDQHNHPLSIVLTRQQCPCKCTDQTADTLSCILIRFIIRTSKHNIFKTLGFLMTMPFVYLPFRYPIVRPNVFQCSGPGLSMCTANSLSTFPRQVPPWWCTTLTVPQMTNNYLYIEVPLSHSYLQTHQDHQVIFEP